MRPERSELKIDARFWSLICERRRCRRFVCAACTLFETMNVERSSEVSGGRYICAWPSSTTFPPLGVRRCCPAAARGCFGGAAAAADAADADIATAATAVTAAAGFAAAGFAAALVAGAFVVAEEWRVVRVVGIVNRRAGKAPDSNSQHGTCAL